MHESHLLTLLGVFASQWLSLACSPEPPPQWRTGSSAETEAAPVYFQSGDLDDDSHNDASLRSWFSKHLAAAREPSLRASPVREAYRFTHLPSFHHPVVIRIEDSRDGRFIVVKELDGAGGYDPGNITVERYRSLKSVEWRETLDELAQDQFWTRSKHDPLPDWDDGTVWVLEGKKGVDYKVVQWYTDDSAACRHLAVLAEIELEGVVTQYPRPPAVSPPPKIWR